MSENMNEIKKIIAFFLSIDAEQITNETVIDNSVLQGSVKIHMMYGDLAENGYKVADYSNIKTFGELLSILKLSDNTNNESEDTAQINSLKKERTIIERDNSNGQYSKNYPTGFGVDILQISKLPHVDDFRESSFYTENFSLSEFSYCLLKADPYKSFAGKFAAKEAIVKANNDFKKSYKGLILISLILNILAISYIAFKTFLP